MKIFIYSDVHISKTSSILPLTSSNPKYTYRQNMIIELGKYLANIIDEEKPDLIINLGDTFDQHTVSSYDIDVASEFFKCFRYINIPHLVLVGNHEMINQDFNAIELLGNINNITVISEPCTINTNLVLCNSQEPNMELAFYPYCDYNDILDLPKGKYLFSHLDIQGSKIRGSIVLENGIEPTSLKQYDLVFNGHIHKSSTMNNIFNVGSVTTHSFSDDDDFVPQCYILDTSSLNLKKFKPTVCPLFRKLTVNSIEELNVKLDRLDKSYKYIVQCVCPYTIKDSVKQVLKNCDLVLNSRLNINTDNKDKDIQLKNEELVVRANIDMCDAFSKFIDTTELKFPKELYQKVLKEVN